MFSTEQPAKESFDIALVGSNNNYALINTYASDAILFTS